MRAFLRRLGYLFRRDRFAAELQEEMRLHVELRARKLQRQGLSERDASYAAQKQFGNRTCIQEVNQEMWGWTAWERLAQDLRHALRTLWKTPSFAVTAVVTLGLGLGMNTAVFSIVNSVMLRRLPYPEPNRLMMVWEQRIEGPRSAPRSSGAAVKFSQGLRGGVAPANLMDWRKSRSFEGLAGFAFSLKNLTGLGSAQRLWGQSVTANFFQVVGVEPEMGRGILPEEDRPGANPVVVISHEFWQNRLNGDPNVLGSKLTLDAVSYQVVGVLPAGFQSPNQFGLAHPIEFYAAAAYPAELLGNHGDHEIYVAGRLRPGVSMASAQAEMDAISAELAQRFPESNKGLRATVGPLQDQVIRGLQTPLMVLLGAAFLIVLIACVNVANLMLVRSASRRHETSVRFALGASRFRIMRHCLVEGLLLAAAGCACGSIFGMEMTRLLVWLAPPDIPRLAEAGMDWRVFAMAAALATITGIAFGTAPAWQASRTRPAESLKAAGKNLGSPSQARWRTALTVVEVALSLVLMVGAGLLLKSFGNLMGVDLGFQPNHVVAMNIPLPNLSYRDQDRRWQFFQQLEERVRAIPGVRSVGVANQLPLRGGWGTGIMTDSDPDHMKPADSQAVSPGYFETLGIPLLRGRLLTPDDRAGQPHVAVVNQAFSRKYLPGSDAIGRRLRRGSTAPWCTIVGVVNDIRRDGKAAEITPQIYLSAAQTDLYPVRLSDLAVRTEGDPLQVVKAVQQQVWALDKDQPVTDVRTLDELIDASLAQRRFQMLLLVLFAALAVTLAAVGIYGVLSYSVSQRTSELGLRMALGANTRDILALVLRQAGWLIAAGVAAGTAGAYALTRYLDSLLFGVHATDGLTYAAAAGILIAVSIAASLIPARRGSHVDPIVALRYE